MPLTERRTSRSGGGPRTLPADAPVLDGELAFRLHDTYGFPIDLTIELAAEYGVRVDRVGFEEALAEQRERSRSGRKAELSRHAEPTGALPGDRAPRPATPLPRLRGARRADDGRGDRRATASEYRASCRDRATAELVLDQTPFYAEGGGQIGDRGEFREEGGGSVAFKVEDTQQPVGRPHRPPRAPAGPR